MFSFSKNVLKLSYSYAEFKNFPGGNVLDPRFSEEESLFLFFKNALKQSYSNAEFKKFLEDNAPTLVLGDRKYCFRSPKMYQNTLSQQCRFQKIFRGQYPGPRFRGYESLFQFSENLPKLSYSNAEFKIFPGDNTPDLRFRGREVCFCSSNIH